MLWDRGQGLAGANITAPRSTTASHFAHNPSIALPPSSSHSDDEALLRKVGSRMLGHLGYRALLACDGAEGVALFSQHRAEIALVLLDIVMPNMSPHSAWASYCEHSSVTDTQIITPASISTCANYTADCAMGVLRVHK